MSRHLFLALSKSLGGRHTRGCCYSSCKNVIESQECWLDNSLRSTSHQTHKPKGRWPLIPEAHCFGDHKCRTRGAYPKPCTRGPFRRSYHSEATDRTTKMSGSYTHNSSVSPSTTSLRLRKAASAWRAYKGRGTEETAESTKAAHALKAIFDHLVAAMPYTPTADRVRTVGHDLLDMNCMEPAELQDIIEGMINANRLLRNWSDVLGLWRLWQSHDIAKDDSLSNQAYEAIIKAFAEEGMFSEALAIFESELLAKGFQPEVNIYATLVEAAVLNRNRQQALSLFEQLVARGKLPTERIFAWIFALLKDVQDDPDARKRLRASAKAHGYHDLQQNPVFQRYLVTAFAKIGDSEQASQALKHLKALTSEPTYLIPAYTSVVRSVLNTGNDIKRAIAIAETIVEDMEATISRRLLRKVYTLLLGAYSHHKYFIKTRALYRKMMASGLFPDQHVYTVLAQAARVHDNVDLVDGILMDFVKTNVKPNIHFLATVMSAYVKAKRLDRAIALFQQLETYHATPDVTMFNVIMHGYSIDGNVDQVTLWWDKLIATRQKPDRISYTILLQSLSRAQDTNVLRLHQRIFTTEVAPDVRAYSVAIDDYLRRGDVISAKRIVDDLCQSGARVNGVPYTAIASAYLKKSDETHFLDTYRQIIDGGHSVDVVAMHLLMRYYLASNRHEDVLRLFYSLGDIGIEPDYVLYHTALITHLKLWKPQNIWTLLETMEEAGATPTAITYDIFIKGAMKKRTNESIQIALQAFTAMRKRGITPLASTYSTIITTMARRQELNFVLRVLNDARKTRGSIGSKPRTTLLNAMLASREQCRQLPLVFEILASMGYADDLAMVLPTLSLQGQTDIIVACWNSIVSVGESAENLQDDSSVLAAPVSTQTVELLLKALAARVPTKSDARRVLESFKKRNPILPSRLPVGALTAYIRAYIKVLSYWNSLEDVVALCTTETEALPVDDTGLTLIVTDGITTLKWKSEVGLQAVLAYWRNYEGYGAEAVRDALLRS
ncbi:hypothetical protein BC832DRAFT_555642 [Gaertneriomyces semiglobifer]|nr:hypothetical protein BC832DRAFT_555642 [Gaertneriomyces semiglobifer]